MPPAPTPPPHGLPDTMRRVVVRELGESPMDALDHHVVLEDAPAPDPASLGPQDVVIAVRSAAVGWVDLLMTSGQYQHAPAPPYTPGLEYSGVVAWTGSAVASRGGAGAVGVGDRVLVDGSAAGPRADGPYQRYGGFATLAVAPASAVLPIPGDLSFDEACNLLGSYETAWHCLVECGRLQAGETVLVHGASGAVGLAAVHVAKLLGATVIATGRSPEKLAAVQAQGAHHVVRITGDDGEPRRFRDDVRALTPDGRGVDVVYDGVGGAVSVESLRCVRFGARFLIVGWAATPFVARGKGQRGAPNANVLPTNLIMMKGLQVLGCPSVIATQHDPTLRPRRLAAVLRWAEEGRIRPHVSRTWPLESWREALLARWRSEVVGGCVLHPAS